MISGYPASLPQGHGNYATYGLPTYGQPTYGQPTYGQPTYGLPTYGLPQQPSLHARQPTLYVTSTPDYRTSPLFTQLPTSIPTTSVNLGTQINSLANVQPPPPSSRLEYIPYESYYIDYEQQFFWQEIVTPIQKKKVNYYSIEHITDYVPHQYEETIVQVVPEEHIKEHVYYIPVETQVFHYPVEGDHKRAVTNEKQIRNNVQKDIKNITTQNVINPMRSVSPSTPPPLQNVIHPSLRNIQPPPPQNANQLPQVPIKPAPQYIQKYPNTNANTNANTIINTNTNTITNTYSAQHHEISPQVDLELKKKISEHLREGEQMKNLGFVKRTITRGPPLQQPGQQTATVKATNEDANKFSQRIQGAQLADSEHINVIREPPMPYKVVQPATTTTATKQFSQMYNAHYQPSLLQNYKKINSQQISYETQRAESNRQSLPAEGINKVIRNSKQFAVIPESKPGESRQTDRQVDDNDLDLYKY